MRALSRRQTLKIVQPSDASGRLSLLSCREPAPSCRAGEAATEPHDTQFFTIAAGAPHLGKIRAGSVLELTTSWQPSANPRRRRQSRGGFPPHCRTPVAFLVVVATSAKPSQGVDDPAQFVVGACHQTAAATAAFRSFYNDLRSPRGFGGSNASATCERITRPRCYAPWAPN